MGTPRAAGAPRCAAVPGPVAVLIAGGGANPAPRDTRTLDSPELRQAFDEVPECR